VLILVRGLPGVGKTTLAAAVAGALAMPLFCKDDVRDTLVGLERRVGTAARASGPVSAPDTPGANLPSPAEWNAAAYTILYALARRQLASVATGVVVEAPLVRAADAAAAATAILGPATDGGGGGGDGGAAPPQRRHRLLLVDCTCAPGVWAARLAARAASAAAGDHRPTDAAAIGAYYGGLTAAEPLAGAPCLTVDTGRGVDALVADVLGWARRHSGGAVV